MSIQYGITEISSDKTQSIDVEEIFVHEEYSPAKNYANDVAVLKV